MKLKKMLRTVCLVVLAAMCLPTIRPTWAADRTWDGNGASPPHGSFGYAPNWSPDYVPGVADTAIFDIDASYAVRFYNTQATQYLDVRDGQVTFFDLSAAGVSYTVSSTTEVDGGNLWVDELAFTTGLLYVGRYAAGDTLRARNAAHVEANTCYVGRYGGAVGTLQVDGSETYLTVNNTLYVGYTGTGTLQVTGNAHVSTGDLVAGQSAGSSGTLDLQDVWADLQVNGNLRLGSYGSGVLDHSIGDTDITVTGSTTLGYYASGVGTATFVGSSDFWHTDGTLTIGRQGDAELTLEGRVDMTADGNIYIARYAGSTATVNLTQQPGGGLEPLLYSGQNIFVGGSDTTAGGTASIVTDTNQALEAEDKINFYAGGSYSGYGDIFADELDVDFAGGAGFAPSYSSDIWVNTLTGFGGNVSLVCGLHLGCEKGGGTGAHTVGAGDSLAVNRLSVGTDAPASLTISGGGTMDAGQGCVIGGHDPGQDGTVLVTGAGSLWDIPADSKVSAIGDGDGTVTVTDGGTVDCGGSIKVGTDAGDGTITISGTESSFLTGWYMQVGGDTEPGHGTVNLNGGLLSVGGDLELKASGSFSTTGGTLRVNGLVGFGDHINLPCQIQIGTSYLFDPGAHDVGAGQSLTVSNILVLGYDAEASMTVSAGGDVEALQMYVGQYSAGCPTSTVTVTGSGSTLTSGYDLIVGYYAAGSLDVNGQGLAWTKRDAFVGRWTANADGVAVIDGTGSRWDVDRDLYIAGSTASAGLGTGTVTVQNGAVLDVVETARVWDNGTLNVNGATLQAGDVAVVGGGQFNTDATAAVTADSVTVDGTGSQWTSGDYIRIAQSSSWVGGMTVSNGGHVSSPRGYIAAAAASVGAVTVETNGSWDAGSHLYVGSYGDGTLTVSDGAAVTCQWALVGYQATGTGSVTVGGSGATLTVDQYVSVGEFGAGTVTVNSGGTLVANQIRKYAGGTFNTQAGSVVRVNGLTGFATTFNGSLHIGHAGGSGSGGYTVGAGDTLSVGEDLVVGYDAPGTLTQQGDVNVGGDLTLGAQAGGPGTVSLNGGTMNAGLVRVGDAAAGQFKVGGGTLDADELLIGAGLGAGGLYVAGAAPEVIVRGQLRLGPNGGYQADAGAVIRMAGADFANECTNAAAVSGLGDTTLIFEGGPAVVDDVEVAGADAGAADDAWNANFAIHSLQLGAGAPNACGRIRLVDAFDNQADGNPPKPGAAYEALYIDSLTINAGGTIASDGPNLYYLNGGDPKQFFHGDADLDGDVDLSDLSSLAFHWGVMSGAAWSSGDFDGDGDVDLTDLSTLAFNWGSATAPPPIPEPACIMLLSAGGVMALRRRRRR